MRKKYVCMREAHSLQEHGIGQDFAMYYIAYAAFSELRGNFSRAESIYQQGLDRYLCPLPIQLTLQCAVDCSLSMSTPPIAQQTSADAEAWLSRMAHPIERLRAKHEEFQQRMVRISPAHSPKCCFPIVSPAQSRPASRHSNCSRQ